MSEDAIARERIEAVERRLARDEAEYVRRFNGFPQEYASRRDVELLRNELEAIKGDHVHRRELQEIKDAQTLALETVRKRLDEGQGRRSVMAGVAAVIATLIVGGFAITQRNAITRADVAAQIQTEAPWLLDRPAVLANINHLTVEDQALKLQIAQIQNLDRFFCRTRAKLLPPC